MSQFCVAAMTADASLRAEHGVLRVKAFSVTSDARRAADRIVQDARDEAAAILDDAQEEAQQAVQEAQRQTLERAAELLGSLEEAHAALLDDARDMILDLAQALFDRLVADTTPRERIAASLARLLQEAPPRLVDAQLCVHPEDAQMLPEVGWEVKEDDTVVRGTCRLEAGNGQWRADFDAAVEALRPTLELARGDAAGPEEMNDAA